MHLKKCDYCQEEFQAVRMSANYCSPSCKQLAYVQRLDNKPEGEEEEEEEENENEDEENYEDLEDENEELKEEPKIEKFSPFSEKELDTIFNDLEELQKWKDQKLLEEQSKKEESTELKYIPLSHEESLMSEEQVIYTPKKDVKPEMDDKDSRQVNATRIFLAYLAHLTSIYNESVKRERFEELLTCFQELQNQYIQKSSKEYSLYPFSKDLDDVIIEMENFVVRYVKEKDKRICFGFGKKYLAQLEDLIEALEGHNTTILKRYR